MIQKRMVQVIGLIICISILVLMLIGCENEIKTTEKTQTSQQNDTLSIKSIEEHIAEKNDFDSFELHTIKVFVIDSKEHYSSIGISGMNVKNGVEEEWSQLYNIDYENFLTLYRINENYLVYDSKKESTDVQLKTLDTDTIELIINCLSD